MRGFSGHLQVTRTHSGTGGQIGNACTLLLTFLTGLIWKSLSVRTSCAAGAAPLLVGLAARLRHHGGLPPARLHCTQVLKRTFGGALPGVSDHIYGGKIQLEGLLQFQEGQPDAGDDGGGGGGGAGRPVLAACDPAHHACVGKGQRRQCVINS